MSALETINKYIGKTFFALDLEKRLSFLPDEYYLKLLYRMHIGRKLNLSNPITFNEKLQWLKLYDHRPEYTMMVDKYKVREYIADKLGEEYLIPLLGVWDDPDDIDFDALPNQFVLKCNHNSGTGMCICKDKSKLDIEKVKKELRKGLAQDYYLTGREWPYKDVPRKIICEKYMVDHSGQELSDYKVHCFNGIPKAILVCSERFSDAGLHEDFYDMKWKRLDVKRPDHPLTDTELVEPKELQKMFSFSEQLSRDYPFMRTDFYEVNGKLYFGEITLYPASDFSVFEPEEWDATFGEWIKLPESTGGYIVKSDNICFWIHEQIEKNLEGLNDYKFMCFNGKVLCSFVCSDRFSNDGLKVTFFDKDWSVLPFERHYPKSQKTIPKPINYEKMIAFSEKLSQGIPFARTDFYEIDGKLYFGEITFFPGSGFEEFTPEEWDATLGNWINLHEKE